MNDSATWGFDAPKRLHAAGALALCLLLGACGSETETPRSATSEPTQAAGQELSDDQVEDLVRRSWQYVAMYNVNNKGAMRYGGWNIVDVDTELKDHTLRLIARPNNDALYITAMLDLRKEPVILRMPAFDSKYVSLMDPAYDHYVNIPLSTGQGEFVSAVLRVMPHAAEPQRLEANLAAMRSVDLEPLSGRCFRPHRFHTWHITEV